MISEIIEILKNLSKPFSAFWSRKEKKKDYQKKVERLKEADERRRKIDELRVKWYEEKDPKEKSKLLKEYYNLIGFID